MQATRQWTSAIALAAALVAGPAIAAPITGTGDPSTDPALARATVVGFETLATGLYPTLTVGDVAFSKLGGPFNVGPDFAGSFLVALRADRRWIAWVEGRG